MLKIGDEQGKQAVDEERKEEDTGGEGGGGGAGGDEGWRSEAAEAQARGECWLEVELLAVKRLRIESTPTARRRFFELPTLHSLPTAVARVSKVSATKRLRSSHSVIQPLIH